MLLITSRRAKVDELLNTEDMSVGSYVLEWENGWPVDDLEEYFNSKKELTNADGWGISRIHQRSIACTNAAIEKYLQNHHIPANTSTHLWQRFDFIVLDEAHSVLADASYQTSPYYVHELVNQAYKEFKAGNSTCRVIVMTGSPKILSNFKLPQNSNHLDLMGTCRSVVPQSLSFVDTVEAKKDFCRRLANGERVVYFANHIKRIFSIYAELSPDLQEVTAFSFSQPERLDINDPTQKNLLERMKATESEISEKQTLPENIKLLLTTSKNKEGINILNKDIKAMYVESHTEVDIVQMAGRVREGIDVLYVVTDAGGFGKPESAWEYKFSSYRAPIDALSIEPDQGLKELNLVEFANDFFCKLLQKNSIDLSEPFGRKPTYTYEKAQEFISFIHSKFPYIRYNYFTDEFVLYNDRKSSLDYYEEQSVAYANASDDKEKLTALAQSWYPGIGIIWPEGLQSQIDRYLAENDLIDTPYDNQTRALIANGLGHIIGKQVNQLRATLGQYGYAEKDCSKNKNSSTYGMKKIIKL